MYIGKNNYSPISSVGGMGLRSPHLKEISEKKPNIGWIEVHPENYFRESKDTYLLEKARELYPLSCHGVGLSLGSKEEVSKAHLIHLKKFIEKFKPSIVSEHVSWNMIGNAHLQDLLPIPYTEESLDAICRNISITQDFLGQEILIENPSLYLLFKNSEMEEHEFILRIVKKTKCKVLLDINNIYVNACNHGYDAIKYIDSIPEESIGEVHLAGHQIRTTRTGKEIRVDTHNDVVCTDVWELYKYFLKTKGAKPTLIEWDQDIPALEVLVKEVHKVDELIASLEVKCAS